jgi:protein SCO1
VSRRAVPLMAALLGAVMAVAGCTSGADSGNAEVHTGGHGGGFHGRALENGYPLPSQEFHDTGGAPFVPADDADGPVTLVFFGYTHCPDICNVVLANVASALRGADAGVRDDVELLFVTTDPARDTGPVVRDYLDRFDPSYVGLVAPEATVKAAARALHIAYEGTTPTGGGYEVSHGTQVTAFTDGSSRVVWPAETSVAGLRADLTRLVEG